ncbi:hypothetical protein ACTFIY_000933 [Dictyostelium cf. discoideum]
MENFDILKDCDIYLQKECEKFKSFDSFKNVSWNIHRVTPLYNFKIQKYGNDIISQRNYLNKLTSDLNQFLSYNLASIKRNRHFIYECKILIIELDPKIIKENELFPSIGIYISSKNIEANVNKFSKIVLVSCRNIDIEKGTSGKNNSSEPQLLSYNMVLSNGDKEIIKEATKWLHFKYDCSVSDAIIQPSNIYSLMLLWTTRNSDKFFNKLTTTTTTTSTESKNTTKPKKIINDEKHKKYRYIDQEYDIDDYKHYANQENEEEDDEEKKEEEEADKEEEEEEEETDKEEEETDREENLPSIEVSEDNYTDDEEDEELNNKNNQKRKRENISKISMKQFEFIYSFGPAMGRIKKKEEIDQSLQLLTLKVPSKTMYGIISHCNNVDPKFNLLKKNLKANQIMEILGNNFKKILGFSLDSLAFVRVVTSEASLEVSGKVNIFRDPFITLTDLSTYV